MRNDDQRELDRLPSGNLPKETRTINGTPYTVTRLGWWDINTLLGLLNDVLGPALAGLVDPSAPRLEDGDIDISWATIVEALPTALARAVGEQGRELQVMLGRQTQIETDGRRVWLDPEPMGVWFAQHPEDLIDWLLFALEVQLAGFFGRLVSRLDTRRRSERAERAPQPEDPEQRSRNT